MMRRSLLFLLPACQLPACIAAEASLFRALLEQTGMAFTIPDGFTDVPPRANGDPAIRTRPVIR